MPVRVLMLSWEYPPMRVGGIAAALEGLAPAVAYIGGGEIEVHVVTCGAAGGDADERPTSDLFLHRVNVDQQANDFIHWVHLLNGKMEERADALLQEWYAEDPNRPVVIHVHDWLGVFAGRSLKHRYHIPLISTIHATEYGRNNGIRNDIQRYINSQEWSLQWESWRVIVCSAFMRSEVEYALGTPWDKIDVIYNGINTANFAFDMSQEEYWRFRSQYAANYEKIIFFIGRMVQEKGAQVLIQSLPKVREQYTNAKIVIAGGGERRHLEDLARRIGVGAQVYFAGRVSDRTRDMLYRIADVAVYPSLYEPFGIVALEAMAARVPVVVSEAGGLPEVVQHDLSGTTTHPGKPDSLAWGIVRVLKNPEFANQMVENAYERVRTLFNWERLAEQTIGVYQRVWNEYAVSDWAKEAGKTPQLLEDWRGGTIDLAPEAIAPPADAEPAATDVTLETIPVEAPAVKPKRTRTAKVTETPLVDTVPADTVKPTRSKRVATTTEISPAPTAENPADAAKPKRARTTRSKKNEDVQDTNDAA